MDSHSCSYCGLIFRGDGYSPDGQQHFCCFGCSLVQKIIGNQSGEGVMAWILVRLGVGAFLSMNVMMLSLVLYTYSSGGPGVNEIGGLHWASFILATPAIVILGGPFLLAGLRDLRRGRIGTDLLAAVGAITAYTISTMHVFSGGGHIYYDTATMLLLIMTIGRLLEASAKTRASRAIQGLAGMIPETARVLRGDPVSNQPSTINHQPSTISPTQDEGELQEIEIPSGEVLKGDLMVVRPGERIPADGSLVLGNCMVVEAEFTGENNPRSCTPGASVYGGSLNCDGFITIRATAVGSDSLLSKIQKMVQQAQEDRAPIERLAERAASWFVPIVWIASISSALYWGILHHNQERAGLSALAVLVVACPCALGFTTSIAMSLAIGKAARLGVLIRSGEILERLVTIGVVFFDKTGTLTANQFSIDEIRVADGIDEDHALSLMASLESGSEHAIAKAIVDAAHEREIPIGPVTDFRSHPGLGVEGTVNLNGKATRITAGSLKLLLKQHKIPQNMNLADENNQQTTAYIGWGGEIRSAILLRDRLRTEARTAIDALKEMRIQPIIISGDRDPATRRVADSLGIETFLSENTPEQKLAEIRTAHKKYNTGIAMIGDGVNDAPALAEADVGIAIGGGTDLARQSSDVILMGDDISRIPDTLALSTFTYRVIKQNLLWAFGYNSIAIGAAFFGYVHPLIAAVAMLLSSVTVIMNSMRVQRWAPKDHREEAFDTPLYTEQKSAEEA